MKKLLAKLVSGKLSTYAAITLTFTYTILLNRNFDCTCKSQGCQCNMYMVLPVFIILLLILLTDGSFQRVCRDQCSSAGCCSKANCNFLCSFFLHIFKAALVSLLWVAFVYLEGDWYVCCENDHSEQQAPLACKAKDNITEKERVIIAELKNTSRVIGGSILCGIVVVASFLPLCLLWIKCCIINCNCCKSVLQCKELDSEEEDEPTISPKKVTVKDPSPGTSPNLEDPSPGNSTSLEDPSPGTSPNQEDPSPGTSPNQKDPSPGTSPNQQCPVSKWLCCLNLTSCVKENPSPGTSTDQELLVRQKDNNQHDE